MGTSLHPVSQKVLNSQLVGGNQGCSFRLGPSPVTTAANPFFSIFSDPTRSFPLQSIHFRRSYFFKGLRVLDHFRGSPRLGPFSKVSVSWTLFPSFFFRSSIARSEKK